MACEHTLCGREALVFGSQLVFYFCAEHYWPIYDARLLLCSEAQRELSPSLPPSPFSLPLLNRLSALPLVRGQAPIFVHLVLSDTVISYHVILLIGCCRGVRLVVFGGTRACPCSHSHASPTTMK